VTTEKDKTSLRPFRVAPFFRTRIWGFDDLSPWFDFKTTGEPIGEVWLTGDQCLAETGPLAGVALDAIVRSHKVALLGENYASETFPLLVKVLFPKEKLSVQVHPDDAMAQKYGDPRGKTECWYALDAQPGAEVALGIKPGADPEKVRAAILNSTMEELLCWLPVEKQDMIFVDAGTVHAIGPGVVLLETQQNSDLTYRMYDYGRPRELHVDRSLEAMRVKTRAGKVPPVAENGHIRLIDEPYFRVDRFALDSMFPMNTLDSAHSPFEDRAKILFVASGAATLFSASSEPIPLGRCQTVIIPASTDHWSVETADKAEVIRIVPQSGGFAKSSIS
jgi:mannose-6-phosphate isomerase